MSLRILMLEEADVAAYARVELEAFRAHPRTPMVWATGYNDSVLSYKEDARRKGLRDADEHSLKCIEVESGQIVAGATYRFAFKEEAGSIAALDPQAPVREDAPPPPDWPDGGNWGITRYYMVNTPKLIQRSLGGQPYIMLDNLTVLPTYQGRRIGQRLLLWGAEQADQRDIRMCLESTPAGRRLYESFGFREVAKTSANMHEFGWEEPYDEEDAVRIFMVREPGGRTALADWRTPF